MACCGTRSRVDGPDVCTLCLEALPLPGPGADVVLKLHACGHCFHRDCAQEMLLDSLRKFQKPRCPNCRATLSTAPFGKLLGQRRQPRLKRMQNMRELISVSEVRSLAARRSSAPGAAPAADGVLTSARSACFSEPLSAIFPEVARSNWFPIHEKCEQTLKNTLTSPPLSFSPSAGAMKARTGGSRSAGPWAPPPRSARSRGSSSRAARTSRTSSAGRDADLTGAGSAPAPLRRRPTFFAREGVPDPPRRTPTRAPPPCLYSSRRSAVATRGARDELSRRGGWTRRELDPPSTSLSTMHPSVREGDAPRLNINRCNKHKEAWFDNSSLWIDRFSWN